MNNYELVSKYPWLIPRDEETDQIIEGYNYEFTWLDDMPEGWKKAFGEQMCEEIQQLLIEADFVDKYEVVQVKEKYGELCWYTNGVPESIHERYAQLMAKYMDISWHTCVECGAPAEYMTTGWVCPYCEKCSEPFKNYRKKIRTEKWPNME